MTVIVTHSSPFPRKQFSVSSDDEQPDHLSRKAAMHEAQRLVQLAIPIVIISYGTVVPPFLVASNVGRHYGSVYLDGFSLANLTGNLFTLSLLQGLFSASDTLSPQAFGAKNYREVGLIGMRAFIGALLVTTPINLILFFYFEDFMIRLGMDTEVAHHAWRWYQIYVLALPFYAIFQAGWKFLAAQSIMIPGLITVCLCCFLILPMALWVWSTTVGFLGTALALLTLYILQAIILFTFMWKTQPYKNETWPGLQALGEALSWKKFSFFLSLGAGGILASSEWIYWETLSLMVGTIGVAELSIHTIPTQVSTVLFILPLGTGIALSIRLGNTLPQSVSRSKELALGCWLTSAVIFGVLCSLCYIQRHWVYSVFTHEPEIIQGAEEIWLDVAIFCFLLCMFGINMGMAVGLGMQWTLGAVTVLWLWVVGLPAAYYFAIYRGGGLNAAWKCVWPPYIIINGWLMLSFWWKDWDAIAAEIRRREGMDDDQGPDEQRSFLKPQPNVGKNGYGAVATSSDSMDP